MKHVLFFYLFIFITIPILGNTLCRDLHSNESKNYTTKIEIIGSLSTSNNKSTSYPLEAFIDASQLTLTFFEATENVTITILSISGIMETRIVSFRDFQSEIFDVSQYTAGSYCLQLTTPKGACLSGYFSVHK